MTLPPLTAAVRFLYRTDAGSYNASGDVAADVFQDRAGAVGPAEAIAHFLELGYRSLPEFVSWGIVLQNPETAELVSITERDAALQW